MRQRVLKQLSFQPEDELLFREEFIQTGLLQIRSLYLLCIVLYGAFSVLDNWLLPATRQSAWLIRFAMIMPLLFIAFLYTFSKRYLRHHEMIASLMYLFAGIGILLMMTLARPSEPGAHLYATGLILVLIALYTGIRVRLQYSLLCAITINLAYPVMAATIQQIQNVNDIGLVILVSNLSFLTGAHLLSLFAGYSLEYTFRTNFRTKQNLEKEHERADNLLQAILPVSIATRLKSGEKTIADEYENVSILFADIVGFTNLSHRIAPLPLVKVLNKLFSVYDDIAIHYGIEKIKTTGDSYMIAAGIPTGRLNHAGILANFAIDIRNRTRLMRLKTGESLQVRIGIHSGKAAGGIIGKSKFIFDVWGDTVNIASRMESHGIPGEIQISEATYSLLKEDYRCEMRGEIDIKGKGMMKAYLLKGRNGAA